MSLPFNFLAGANLTATRSDRVEQYLAIICGSVLYFPRLHKRLREVSKARRLSLQPLCGSYPCQGIGEHSLSRFGRLCSRWCSDGTQQVVCGDGGWHVEKTVSIRMHEESSSTLEFADYHRNIV